MHPAGKAMAAVAVPVAVLASLWYVNAPPQTEGDYRERAAMTGESLRSQLETAGLWVRELEREHVTHQAAVVAFREAEEDAVASATEFAAWDPPGDTRRIRSDLLMVATEATDTLAELRLAAEDGRWEALPTLARSLPQLAQRLESVARAADP